jgi:hypothetical protein
MSLVIRISSREFFSIGTSMLFAFLCVGRDGRRKGGDRLETGRVRIMAVDAEKRLLFTVPETCSLAVNACLPVAKGRAVTLAAEPVRLLEVDACPVGQVQVVTIFSFVAVEAPAILLVVQENDILVRIGHLTAVSVDVVRFVALAAGEDVLAEGRGLNGYLLLGTRSSVRLRAFPFNEPYRNAFVATGVLLLTPGTHQRGSQHDRSQQGENRECEKMTSCHGIGPTALKLFFLLPGTRSHDQLLKGLK